MTLNIPSIFQQAFRLYQSKFALMMTLGLTYALATQGAYLALQKLNVRSASSISLLSIFVSSFFSIALIYASHCVYTSQQEEIDINRAFAAVRGRYLNYVTVSISFFVLVISGMMFFVLPGAYFGTVFMFADLLVVLEDKKFVEAFQRSLDLVRGYFWPIFLFSMASACILLFPGVIFSHMAGGRVIQMCLMVFVVPYVTMAQVGLYLRIKAIKDNNA